MAEDLDQIVDNIKQPTAWIRVLFMLGFAVLLYVVIAPIIAVLMLAQFLFSLLTGDSNRNLRYLGASLTQYVSQILEFIFYNSELKPFPFSDFPSPAELDDYPDEEEETVSTTTKHKASARKKSSKRKTTTRKSNTDQSDSVDMESGTAKG